jgi:hypothetical protein
MFGEKGRFQLIPSGIGASRGCLVSKIDAAGSRRSSPKYNFKRRNEDSHIDRGDVFHGEIQLRPCCKRTIKPCGNRCVSASQSQSKLRISWMWRGTYHSLTECPVIARDLRGIEANARGGYLDQEVTARERRKNRTKGVISIRCTLTGEPRQH